MSIVRMGMAEDDKFGAGYDAIFGAKPKKATKKAAKQTTKNEKKDEKKKDEKKK